MTLRTFRLALLLLGALFVPAAAAQSRDSIPHWTDRLAAGSLPQRVHAVRQLAGLDARSLPPETKRAFIVELNRINALRLAHEPVEGADVLPPETFGRYYIDLVATTVAFNTEESENAVVRAVAVSGGLQRRVARRGDVATPMLVEMIERGHEPGAALETLGLIWFHADSAGTPLSPATRTAIVRQLLSATTSPSFSVRRSAVLALRATADPAFLPLAEHFARRSSAANDRVIGRAALQEAVPALRVRARRTPPGELSARVARVTLALCEEPGGAERSRLCAEVLGAMAGGAMLASHDNGSPSRRPLADTAARVDDALAEGTLGAEEHALVAGGLRLLARRLR